VCHNVADRIERAVVSDVVLLARIPNDTMDMEYITSCDK
jgi:hypothetical protein